MNKRPRQWPRLGRGPHAAALLLSKDSSMPLVCSEQTLPDPKCAPEKFPTLEQLLCSLVFRANHPGEEYPTLKNNQCESVAPTPTTQPAGGGGSGIGAWFKRLFGQSGRATRGLPQAVTDQAGPLIQRGTETLGAVAAANWLWQRARRPQRPPAA